MATTKPKAPSLTLCIELNGAIAAARARLKDGRALAVRLRPKAVCLFFTQDAGLIRALGMNKRLLQVNSAAWGALPVLSSMVKNDWIALFPAEAAIHAQALEVEAGLLDRSDLFLYSANARLDERLWMSLHRFTNADLSGPALLRVQALQNAARKTEGRPVMLGAQFLRSCLDSGARVGWRGTASALPGSASSRPASRPKISVSWGRMAWTGATAGVFLLAKLLFKVDEATLAVLAMSGGILMLGQALGERA